MHIAAWLFVAMLWCGLSQGGQCTAWVAMLCTMCELMQAWVGVPQKGLHAGVASIFPVAVPPRLDVGERQRGARVTRVQP